MKRVLCRLIGMIGCLLLSGFCVYAAGRAEYGYMAYSTNLAQEELGLTNTTGLYHAPASYANSSGSVNLLSHLHYSPVLWDQGHSGTCWLWGNTAVMSIEYDVAFNGSRVWSNGFSVQFPISYGAFVDVSLTSGGTGGTFAKFYNGVGYAVPWTNANAAWTSDDGALHTPGAWIYSQPNCPLNWVSNLVVATYQLAQTQSIANIKSALDAHHALAFDFRLADSNDWHTFFRFWDQTNENVIIDLTYGTNKTMSFESGGGAHTVACVGYDDTDPDPKKHYWLMLNSWGVIDNLRTNGLFRVAMDTDYSATVKSMGDQLIPVMSWNLMQCEFSSQTNKRMGPLSFNLGRPVTANCYVDIEKVSFPIGESPSNILSANLELNKQDFTCDAKHGTWSYTTNGYHFQTFADTNPVIMLDVNTNAHYWSVAATNFDLGRFIDPHQGLWFSLDYTPASNDGSVSLGGMRGFAYDELSENASYGFVNPRSLTVLSPANGAVSAVGDTLTVSWNAVGLEGKLLDISIDSGGSNVKTIGSLVPAESGSYVWTVPWEYSTGTNFQIRISVDGITEVIYSGLFTIGANTNAALYVRAPAGGESWVAGASRGISWQAFNLSGTLSLQLLQGGSVVDTVSGLPISSNRCLYTIPAGLAAGTNYTIRLTSSGSAPLVATSQPFGIVTQALAGKKWTILLYQDGDAATVEPQAIDSILDLAKLGSSSNINYVCQLDRNPGYDTRFGNWYDTRRFYITKGLEPYGENACQALGELNMSSPETLTDFINWATENYPAEQYFLILSDHGTGWETGLITDDSNSGYNMSTRQLQQALDNAPVKMTLLGIDTCLEGDVEVAYQVRNCGPKAMIASQFTEQANWPYDVIFGELERKLEQTTPLGLAALACQSFVDHAPATNDATLSAVDLTKLDALTTSMAALADTMRTNYTSQGAVRPKADAAKAAVRDAVFYSARTPSLQARYQSLNLFFPSNSSAPELTNYNSSHIDFPAASHWSDFLNAYYGNMSSSWIGQVRQAVALVEPYVDLYSLLQGLSPATNDVTVTFLTIGSGDVEPIREGSLVVTNGQSLILRATTQTNDLGTNHFVRWMGDSNAHFGDEFAPQTTLRVTGNTWVRAYFAENKATYAVRFISEGNGTLNGTNFFEVSVPAGQNSAPVLGRAEAGCSFAGWGGDFSASANPLVLTNVQMDMTVLGFFWSIPPTLSIEQCGSNVVLSWPVDVTAYKLETTTQLQTNSWNAVSGVTTNSVTLPISRTNAFFRLRYVGGNGG